MSNSVSALSGASYTGFVKVEEMGLRGMITVRGNLKSAKLKKAVKAASGAAVPGTRAASVTGEMGVAWMSPDELLVMVPYVEVDAKLAAMHKALDGEHALAVNVSDARAVFQISGRNVRDVMAKLSPVDMAPGAFEPGMFRRTRMAQVAAAFWMVDAETIQIVCFRSVALYVFNLLKDAAEPGSEVGYFA